ncbi:unnamed protein product [Calicophoron daubneyi]|uniref:C2H2-type domain-containing protein n=1 Tax=Calicophoron daubneyi TaxID=300641 RepID=A0AAV2TWU5_CALDB
MASDLVTVRMPLLEKQSSKNECTTETHDSANRYKNATYYSAHSASSSESIESSNHNPAEKVVSGRSSISMEDEPSHCVANHTSVAALNYTNSGISYMYNGGFRYQIRRPVESWKFVETRKQDGSVLYLCRICGSGYKHKKSLNKHWKDKHSEVPCPEGSQVDEDDDDDEDSEDDIGETPVSGIILDKENIENCPPLGVTTAQPNSQTIAPQIHSPPPTTASSQLSPSMGTAACRRFSTPISRSGHRSTYIRRSSLLPSPLGVGQQGTKDFSFQYRKRFRPHNLHPVTAVYPSQNVEKPSAEQAPSAKRRLSALPYGETDKLTSPKGDRPENIASKCVQEGRQVYFQTDPKCTYPPILLKERNVVFKPEGKFIADGLTSAGTEICTPSHSTSKLVQDYQPLDLSTMKPAPNEQNECKVGVNSEVVSPKANSSEVNSCLLIGLLQTALNTLRGELGKESHSLDDRHKSGLRLSRTSTSLLFAIGTLLVALMDEHKDDLESKPDSKVPGAFADFPTRIPLSKDVPPYCTMPILPPVPGAALVSSALDPIESNMSVNAEEQFSLQSSFHDDTEHPRMSAVPRIVEQDIEKQVSMLHSNQHIVIPPNQEFSVTENVEQRHNDCVRPSFTCASTSQGNFQTDPHVRTSTETALTKNGEGYECAIVCPVCKFDARWFSELRAHMVNHSEHRMFGCCYCPYRAKWKWDVAKHMRRCPLGRHVAHLSNEALLRMVRYNPPPSGDILFNYFPQDGFPGVGLDRPPSPPTRTALETNTFILCNTKAARSEANPPHAEMVHTVPRSSEGFSSHPSVCEPPPIEASNADTANQHTSVTCSSDMDRSPEALVIVDSDLHIPRYGERTDYSVEGGKTSYFSSQHQAPVSMINERVEVAYTTKSEVIATSGLVCKLRKCTHCAFHSADDQEFKTHLQIHHNAPDPNSAFAGPANPSASNRQCVS